MLYLECSSRTIMNSRSGERNHATASVAENDEGHRSTRAEIGVNPSSGRTSVETCKSQTHTTKLSHLPASVLSPSESIQCSRDHLQKSVPATSAGSFPSSPLGQRIWQRTHCMDLEEAGSQSINSLYERQSQTQPPEDFLRLPCELAVLRYSNETGKLAYQLVADMEKKVLDHHHMHLKHDKSNSLQIFSRCLYRNSRVGLGMTLCDAGSHIAVHSLISKDGNRWRTPPTNEEKGSPAIDAQIRPGDVVLGVNGKSLKQNASFGTSKNYNFFMSAILTIQKSPEPVVLHIYRPTQAERGLIPSEGQQSSPNAVARKEEVVAANGASKSALHPFAIALASKGLIAYGEGTKHVVLALRSISLVLTSMEFVMSTSPPVTREDEVSVTRKLAQLTYRARQWEVHQSATKSATMLDHWSPQTKSWGLGEISTPCLEGGSDVKNRDRRKSFRPPSSSSQSFPGSRVGQRTDCPSHMFHKEHKVTPPLFGVRKGLSVRILNSFLEGNLKAYTIWVFDVESGREWYAPVRYYADFCDLRAATQLLSPIVSQIPFPATKWNVFGRRGVSERDNEDCRKLEHFLRVLSSIAYREKFHPGLVQVAEHVQSFLGCDLALPENSSVRLNINNDHASDIRKASRGKTNEEIDDNIDDHKRLKRSIQSYIHRLFLLDVVDHIVCRFVGEVRSKGVRVVDVETPKRQGCAMMRKRSLNELENIRLFLDQLQEVVVQGCMADLTAISLQPEFANVRRVMEAEEEQTSWNRLVRDSVRERVEIEVYVPVRSVVSGLLVNGWRHDDIEIKFKMQELRNRPPASFRIPGDKKTWISVSRILEDGVGRSTLPCVKLRAIVKAAEEITRVYSSINGDAGDANDQRESAHGKDASTPRVPALGADDFLPIFIYCVVQAKIERPCALCVLLNKLCDLASRIGETGYYLSSFEAAITHIEEIDLADYV